MKDTKMTIEHTNADCGIEPRTGDDDAMEVYEWLLDKFRADKFQFSVDRAVGANIDKTLACIGSGRPIPARARYASGLSLPLPEPTLPGFGLPIILFIVNLGAELRDRGATVVSPIEALKILSTCHCSRTKYVVQRRKSDGTWIETTALGRRSFGRHVSLPMVPTKLKETPRRPATRRSRPAALATPS